MHSQQDVRVFIEDLRSAARSLLRARGLTTLLVVSLGVGTGANAAVYSVIDALLFSPAAGIEDAGSLATVYTSGFDGAPFGLSSLPDAVSVDELPSATSVALLDDRLTANIAVAGLVRSTRVSFVSGAFFDALRMRAFKGRLLDADDEGLQPASAVISAELWEAAGRPEPVEGLTATVGRDTYHVAGVAPRGFRGLEAGRLSDVWVPLRRGSEGARGDRRFSVIARLAPARTVAHLQAELDILAQRLAAEFPATNRGTQVRPDAPRKFTASPYAPMHPSKRTHMSFVAFIVMGAVALLLFSACVNAGALLLSRGFARTRELAVKMALGAGRPQLAWQLMLESVLASLAGGAAGLLFAYWTLQVLPAFFAPDHAALLDRTLQIPVVLVTLGGALAAGIAFGVAPAFYATASPAATALRADTGAISQPGSGSRLRGVLVASQIALSTSLLLCAGLLAAAFSRSLNADPSFPTRQVIVARMDNSGALGGARRGIDAQRRLAALLKKTDRVEALGWSSSMVAAGVPARDYRVEAGAAGLTETVELDVHVVSPGYFDALGLALVEGRVFDANDRPLTEPVVIVDEIFARRYFGAVASNHFLVDPEGERLRIVGVVRPRRFRTFQGAPRPVIYYPFTQNYPTKGFLFFRTSGDPDALMRTLRERIESVDRHALIERIATLEERLGEQLALERMTLTLVGACGVLALLMAMVGVYGVLNDAVQRRTREIGLRVALGAARTQVIRLVLAEVAAVAVVGFGAGAVLALGAERLLRIAVAAPAALDLVKLGLAPAALATIVVMASVVPLWRALRVSAAVALRTE